MDLTIAARLYHILLIFAVSALVPAAMAQNAKFHAGTVISDYGPIASVDTNMGIPVGTVFKVAFDVTEPAKPGELNRGFVTAARFLNMHAEAGVALADMHLAIVVHGGAVHDATAAMHYAEHAGGAENANARLIAALQAAGVRVIMCGQSAAFNGVENTDLLPGVEMALSAMTAHALLQQGGYTLNPF